jgi:PLP dependent protein
MTARREEIARGLDGVRDRIATACSEAGRDPRGVRLIVVTKFFPVSDVRLLSDLGVRDVGENRDQEAREKLTDPALDDVVLTRHFIGQLQSNKAASVVDYAEVIHTADRAKVVAALGRAAVHRGRRPRVLVQVSLDDAPDRGGAAVDDVPGLADRIAAEPALELGGVMAVAPLGADPDAAFARLWEVATRIQADHPAANWVSAGMSGDLEAAVRHGATHLRVGSAILGSRPTLR